MNTIVSYSDTERDGLLSLWGETLPLDAITADVLEARVLLDENFDPYTFLISKNGTSIDGFALGTHAKRMPLGDADPAGIRCWITAFGIRPGADFRSTGTALLEEIETRFRRLGKQECSVSTYPPGYFIPGIDRKAYGHLYDFFQEHGYQEIKEALSMDASIVLFEVPRKTIEVQRKLEQQNIVVRPYMRSDLVQFLEFLDQYMPTDWVRVERANLKMLTSGHFKTDQVTVVQKEKRIIGYCQYEGSHFGPFGVSSEFQGQGIGTVLLARTLERMRHNGYHNAWVMWTDDVAAKVYAKFGFKETRRFSIMHKRL